MKRLSLLLVFFVNAVLVIAAEAPIKLKLYEVKVYLSGAELTHAAKLKLKEGNNEFVLENIAEDIAANSINAHISGGAMIMDISEKRDFLAVAVAPAEAKKLQDSIEAINLKITYLNNEISALNAEEEILNQNKVMSTRDKSLTPAEIREMSKLYYDSKLEISNSRVRLSIDIKKLNERVSALKKQINELNLSENTALHQLVLTAYSKTAQTVDLTVKYYISAAGWSPFYDIRATGANKPIAFYNKATVWQNSGLDFNDVKLTISSRNPTIYGDMPQIVPIALNIEQQILSQTSISAGVTSSGSGFYVRGSRSEETQIKVEGLEIESETPNASYAVGYVSSFSSPVSNYITTEFTADVKYTIPSDGKERHIELSPTEAHAEFEYYTAPKYQAESYLVAKIDDWENANLLPGEANVYFENSFIGKTSISPEITTDTLSVSLGADKNVIVKREALKDFTESKFLSSDIERTFAYKITVKNAKSEKIKITIEDQVPVSKNEEIKVKFIEGSGSEPDKDTGKVTWVAEIEPGKTLEKTLIYSVRHPASKKVIGL